MSAGQVLRAALRYAAAGHRVLPVFGVYPPEAGRRSTAGGLLCRCNNADCPRPGKHPLVSGNYYYGTTDAGVIRGWWGRWGWANVALAMGAAPNVKGPGLIAIDVDEGTRKDGSAKEGHESLAALEKAYGTLPLTPRSLTGGGGEQWLFESTERLHGHNTAGRLGPDLDVRVDGGIVVVPDSLHTSGRRYTWDAGAAFGDVPIAPAPAWLLDLIAGRVASPLAPIGISPGRGALGLRPLLDAKGGPIPVGQRNEVLFGRACAMRGAGLDEREIYQALEVLNRTRCNGDLPHDELARIARSVGRYTPEASKASGARFVPTIGRGAARAAAAGVPSPVAPLAPSPPAPPPAWTPPAPAAGPPPFDPLRAPPVVPAPPPFDPAAFAALAARRAASPPAWARELAPTPPSGVQAVGADAFAPEAPAPAAPHQPARPVLALVKGGGGGPPSPPGGGGGPGGSAGPPDDTRWQGDLRVNARGGLKSTTSNVELIMRHHDAWAGRLAYDKFREHLVWTGPPPYAGWYEPDEGNRPVGDLDFTRTQAWFARNGNPVFEIDIDKGTAIDAMLSVGHTRGFDPVVDYLRGLTWDNTARVTRFFVEMFGAEDTPYVHAVTRVFFVGAVRRALEPGCKHDTMLVLVGPGGAGKSQAIAALVPEPSLFTDDIGDIRNGAKVPMEQLQGRWIAEDSELKSIRQAGDDAAKRFLSMQEDAARLAYGRSRTTRPRRSALLGTTNRDLYLRDDAGNRRFHSVRVHAGDAPGRAARVAAMRDQLWAEAVALYRERPAYSYLTDEEKGWAADVEALHHEGDPWDDTIGRLAAQLSERREPVAPTVFLGPRSLNVPHGQRTKAHAMRVVSVLKRLGWRPCAIRFGRFRPTHLWLPPTMPPRAEYLPAFEAIATIVHNRLCEPSEKVSEDGLAPLASPVAHFTPTTDEPN